VSLPASPIANTDVTDSDSSAGEQAADFGMHMGLPAKLDAGDIRLGCRSTKGIIKRMVSVCILMQRLRGDKWDRKLLLKIGRVHTIHF